MVRVLSALAHPAMYKIRPAVGSSAHSMQSNAWMGYGWDTDGMYMGCKWDAHAHGTALFPPLGFLPQAASPKDAYGIRKQLCLKPPTSDKPRAHQGTHSF